MSLVSHSSRLKTTIPATRFFGGRQGDEKKNVKVASDNPLNYPFTDWSKGANLAPPSQKKNIFIFKYPLAFSPRAATDILTKATAIRVTRDRKMDHPYIPPLEDIPPLEVSRVSHPVAIDVYLFVSKLCRGACAEYAMGGPATCRWSPLRTSAPPASRCCPSKMWPATWPVASRVAANWT